MDEEKKALDNEAVRELDNDVLSDRKKLAEREAAMCREQMKKLLSSRFTLACAVAQSLAALTVFLRGMNLFLTFTMFIVYGMFASGFWILHFEAKKITKMRSHGAVVLSVVTKVQALVVGAVLLFALIYTSFGVFGKKLFSFMSEESFNIIKDLNFWFIPLVLVMLLVMYLAKQYYEPKIIFYSNLTDAIEIDVAFSLYAYRYGRANFYLAVGNIIYYVFKKTYPMFSEVPLMPQKLGKLLDMYSIGASHGVAGSICAVICSASLALTGVFAFKYVNAAKKIQID